MKHNMIINGVIFMVKLRNMPLSTQTETTGDEHFSKSQQFHYQNVPKMNQLTEMC